MKFLTLMVTLVAVRPLVADTQSDWYASLSDKREATSVRVGGEYWRTSDEDKPLPYRFPCGAVLHSTAGGLRLDLNNTIIDGGIYAYGDISIFLIGDSVSFGSVKSEGSMLIFGYGSLLVNRLDKPGSYDSLYYGGVTSDRSLSVCMGASVTVKEPAGTGLRGRDSVLISASTVGVHGAGQCGIFSYNRVDILGAVVAISSYCDGIEAQGGGGVVIDGSVLNVFSRYDGIEGYAGINVTHSYVSIASIVNDVRCYALRAIMSDNAEVRLENSIVKLLSKGFSAINTYKVAFGKGDYYIAVDSPYSGAISVDDVYVSGGNVRVCAPGEDGSCVSAIHFQIDSGRLEVVDKIDVREFLKFDAAAAALYTGVVTDGTIDVSSFMANFYSQVILDAISNAKIGNLNGVPNVGIDCSDSFDTYIQNGGTVWCDLTKYGVMCDKPVMNGGSYKGQFYSPRYSSTISGGHDPVSPINSSGNALKCVSYAVAGAKKYDKITQSWSGILPSYYGTGSLYTDAAGKLYFWVPESWNVPGGSSGGSGGGGSGGGTTADVDLEPYTPSGWSAPLAFSTGYYSDSAESDTFRTANTVYAKIAFNNGLSATISSTFHVAVYVDGALKYSTDVNGLKSGYYYYVTGIQLGSFAEGTHTVKMIVDSGGAIPESDESNNTYTRTFTVSNPAQYTIFFYRNAKPNDREVAWRDVGINENYPLPTMAALKWSKDGDTFLGWATSETAKTAQYVAGQSVRNLGAKGSKVSLYGVWRNRVSSACIITFNANGGSVTETKRSLAYGSALGTLPSPVREGYTFDGWYTSISGYGQVNSSTIVTGSATYYAHWTKIEGFYLSGAYVADKSRTFMGAAYYYYNPAGVISLKIGKTNKKGVFKVSGSLMTTDGKKHTLKATAASQNGGFVTVKDIQVKGLGTLTVKIAANGFTGTLSNGWTARTANVSSLEKGRLKFDVNPYPTSIKGVAVLTQYLPQGLIATSDGASIVFPKAGRVAFKNGKLSVSNGEGNPSGLKLKFAPRTGCITGSFAVYTFDGRRLKRWNAKMTGICVEGKARMSVKISGVSFAADIVATLDKMN